MRYTSLLGLFFFSVSLGLSCNCPTSPPSSMESALEASDYAFVGKVVQVDSDWISGGWKFAFQVSNSWKKTVDELLVIHTGWEKDCGYIFKEGGSYLVFVKKKFTPKTAQCMGNLTLSEAEASLEFLGEGYEPRPNPNRIALYWIIGGIAAATMFGMLFIILRKRF